MKIIIFAVIACFCFIFSQISFAEEVILGQHPAPSPNGKIIAFSFRGDIWTVPATGGQAVRLTVHEAYESLPVWSPDGRKIAFSSNRNGNDDIFVMNADGSNVTQLTFLSQADDACDWTPDGKSVIFSSRRDFSYPSNRLPSLYRAELDGGTPTMLMPDFGSQGKISPDGRYILFSEGRLTIFRKHYHGSMNSDIWRYDQQTGEFLQLTDFDGNDFNPLWSKDGNLVYFISHKDDTGNIWQMNPDGSGKKQLTSHKDDGAYYANISRNTDILTYTRGSEIWLLNLATGKNEPLKISVPGDAKTNSVAWEKFSKDATEMALSPDEKFIAAVIHGEIFIYKNKDKGTKKTVRLTHSPFREKDICWTPKGDTLLFVSDYNGNDDIFMIISDDAKQKNLFYALNHKIIQLTNDKTEEVIPKVSPDGKTIAFIRDHDLWTMDREGKNAKRLVKSWNGPEFNWSPDSKWLAYSRLDAEFNTDVFIISAEGSEPVNITRHPDDDTAPVWSADGKKLGFVSRRYDDTFDIWFVFLQKADDEKTKEEWEDEEDLAKEKQKDDKSKEDTTPKDEKVVVKIDFKDIHKRLRRITRLPGEETELSISPDGKVFAFRCNTKGKNDLWTVEWDGKELKQLTDSNERPEQLTWSKDGKLIYYLKSGGTIHSISASGSDKKSFTFDGRMEIDKTAERLQMFDEAWRVLNQNFYDPQFHGADWQAIHKKYRKIIEKIGTSDDFYTTVRMMLGELNASHLGIYPPDKKGGIRTGMPGVKFDLSWSGTGLKVASVMPNGPCDQANSKVAAGEILTAINGIEITNRTNIYQILNQQVGETVQLSITQNKTKREIRIQPVSFGAWQNLDYQRWVNQKREMVNEWSDGKLGYVHIRGMGWDNLQQFQAELFSEGYGKDGLLIDVRFNGGGWITDYLLTMLQVKPHAYTIPRDGARGYPQSRLPFYAWTKPIATLCNQYSYSNAEIFSHAVKVLKLGKVIGEPTPGVVISTGGTTLLDGSQFRIPFRGWYNLETGLNQENNGCIPDFVIEVQPGDEAKDVDRQLKKAVDELKLTIEN